MGREGKAADGHRAGEFREPSGGSGRDTECNPEAERITALPGQIGAAAASGVTGGAEGCGRDLGEEGPA